MFTSQFKMVSRMGEFLSISSVHMKYCLIKRNTVMSKVSNTFLPLITSLISNIHIILYYTRITSTSKVLVNYPFTFSFRNAANTFCPSLHHSTRPPYFFGYLKNSEKKEKRTAREKYAPLLRNVVEAVTEKGGCLNFVFRWPKNLLAKGSFSHDNKLFNNIVLRFLLSPSVPHLLHKPTRRDLSARRQFTLNLPPREPPLQPLSLMWNAQCMLSLRFPMCILCMIQKIL